MDEWERIKIGDIATSVSDTYRGNDKEVILVNTSDVLDGTVLNHQKVINGNLRGQFKKTFQKDDILYSEIRPANKRFAYIDFEDTSCYIASTKLMVIRPNTEKVLPRYLYAILTSNEIINELQHLAETRSGTFPQITFSGELAPIEIMLPDLDIQQRIVGVLSAIEGKRVINEAINQNLELQALTLFKSWFVDFELSNGDIPNTWYKAPLGNFVDIKRGGSPRPIQDYLAPSGLHWLKISDVTSITGPYIQHIKEYIKKEGLKKTVFLKAGSLVLSNSATPGIPKILDVDTCIHDGWLYFPNSKLSNYYLYLLFSSIRDDLVSLGNGSVFTNLKTDIIRNYPIIKADEETLRRFDEIASPLFKEMLIICRETDKLCKIRDILLPQLMSGELDVSGLYI